MRPGLQSSGGRILRCSLVVLLSICIRTGPAAFAGTDLEDEVVEYRLDNGLTFLLLERPYPPTFSANITYRAGSVDEVSGKTGIAHLLEHMAFKGTETIGTTDYRKERPVLEKIDELARSLDRERDRGESADSLRLRRLTEELEKARNEEARYVVKDEIGKVYSENGAVGLNASTSVDLTRYYVSLPSNRIELWMYIESERMKRPVYREFYTERDVVMEERRQRTLTNPFGMLYESFMAAAYMANPYGRPTVGWTSDLEHLTVADAREFRERHYIPSNCVVAIVGDIDVDRTESLLERYFGPIEARERQPEVVTVEPEQEGDRRVEVMFDAEPVIIVGWHKPALPHHDDYVFDLIDIILSSGRTSRLYRGLVEGGLALSAGSTTDPGNRFPNLFTVSAATRSPHTAAELETAIEREIELLAREPVSEEELARAMKKIETSFVQSLASNAGLAGRLSYFQAVAGDYRYIVHYPEVIRTITREDIRDVATRYLTPEKRTVGILVKEAAP